MEYLTLKSIKLSLSSKYLHSVDREEILLFSHTGQYMMPLFYMDMVGEFICTHIRSLSLVQIKIVSCFLDKKSAKSY